MTHRLPPTFAAALNALPQRERDVLTLYEIEGASTDRIGVVLGISSAEARLGLLQARRALQQYLTGHLRLTA